MAGRSKWDAWTAVAKSYNDDREKAEERYLEIARTLGWTDNASQSYTESNKEINSSTDILPHEISISGSSRGGGGEGMGASVSAMAPPPFDEQDGKTLHGLAVANKVSGLSSYLEAHPTADINAVDEHVCCSCFYFVISLNIFCAGIHGSTFSLRSR
jgi:hypothetical protein